MGKNKEIVDTVEVNKEKKTILDVDYNEGFHVECYNLLENPEIMHLADKGYERLNLNIDLSHVGAVLLDTQRVVEDRTKVLIVLKYFEYICIATVKFSYILEIVRGDFALIDAIHMIKHHLKNKLIREVRGTENIIDMHIEYKGYVKY